MTPKTLVQFAEALTTWGLNAWIEERFGGYNVYAARPDRLWNRVSLLRYQAGRIRYLWWQAEARGRGLQRALRTALKEPRYGRFLFDMRSLYRL